MKTLLLQRQSPNGKAVRGIMKPSDGYFAFYTLENNDFIIPPGTYTLTVTYSPRFKKDLPLVNCVAGRSGIRFHRGTLPEHSKGCILLSTNKDVDILTSFIRANEKILLTITSASAE